MARCSVIACDDCPYWFLVLANVGYCDVFIVADGSMSYYRLNNQQSREAACKAVLSAPEGYICKVTQETRSLDQNALLWPILSCISKQVEWYGRKLTPYEWKDVFSAALRKSQVVPGLDGGFVVLGQRTSVMPKHEFSELIEMIYAFGADKGVDFVSS